MKTRVILTDFIEELIYQVVLANRHLSDAAEMPDTQYKALRYVHKKGDATMKQIADFTGVSMPRATKIADSLVESGYAKRMPTTDRRCVKLALTKKGQSAIDEATVMHQQLSETILAPLTDTEREQMYYLVSKCYEQLKSRGTDR